MAVVEVPGVTDIQAQHLDQQPDAGEQSRRFAGARRVLGNRAMWACVSAGTFAGISVAYNTDTNLDIAGTPAAIEQNLGQTYDQVNINDQTIVFRQANNRQLAGEAIGVNLNLQINEQEFEDKDGHFDPHIIPAYIQLFSDRKQIASDIEWAVIRHDIWGAGGGAFIGAAAFAGAYAYRRRQSELSIKRITASAALATSIAIIPGSVAHIPGPTEIHTDSRLASTPFANIEIDGWLRPGITYGENYIEQYLADDNAFYDQLAANQAAYLGTNPVTLPTDPTGNGNIEQVGFVTDRHCNIGMDRVIIALLKHYGAKTLVSAGDDAFSGSFSFESACTRYLAERSTRDHITDVFVGGNHDSPMTIAAEADQGIKTLTGDIVTVNGLHFIGLPDPRTSRYGQGLEPSDPLLQAQLLKNQGLAIGKSACQANEKVIGVAHDPGSGLLAMQHSCGNMETVLDGHTHVDKPPVIATLPANPSQEIGVQVVGGSAGGAPGAETTGDSNPLSHITIGKLNHVARVAILSIDRRTGQLVGKTTFSYTPNLGVSVQQNLLTDPALSFNLSDGRHVAAKLPRK